MATRATPPLLKHLNERAVLEAIRGGAPISRAEIARRTGISKPTVSLALRALHSQGLVRETAPDPNRPHYGALFFEPVPEAALVLAVDIGTRFMRAALGDLGGNVLARRDVPFTGHDLGSTIATVASLCAELVDEDERALLDGAVVGVPGVVHPVDGSVSLASNALGIEGARLADRLADALELAVQLENDINLAALGEQWRGVARGVDDFLFLSIGTGMGAGLVLRGELHRGRNGAAGELDYARAGRDDDIDPCAEALSPRGAGVARGAETELAPPFEPRAIFAAARGGDALAATVV